jgi:hypothetical protein
MASNIGTLLSGLLSNSATSGIATTIFNQLGSHMTTSSAVASSVGALLEQMQQNPTTASTYAALIAAQPNVPAGVMTYVNAAVQVASDKTAFITEIVQAKAALQAATSSGTLGSILSAL